MVKKIFIALTTLILVVITWQSFTPAQTASGLSSRLSRLEAENFQLRLQLNQLESQVSNLSRIGPQRTRIQSDRSEITVAPPAPKSQAGAESQFDRLATLVIELKERIVKLESQVSQLESQVQKRIR